jgi:hypothetical protein
MISSRICLRNLRFLFIARRLRATGGDLPHPAADWWLYGQQALGQLIYVDVVRLGIDRGVLLGGTHQPRTC